MLLALSERFGKTSEQGVMIDLGLTNEDLAAITGVSRQFTNTTLQELRASGVISGRNRSLVIARPGRTRSYGAGAVVRRPSTRRAFDARNDQNLRKAERSPDADSSTLIVFGQARPAGRRAWPAPVNR